MNRTFHQHGVFSLLLLLALPWPSTARAEGDWEITPQSEQSLERGLEWLAKNQGAKGNWTSNDLGLVSTGVLAFLAAGHLPDRGRYGETVRRGLDYVLENAKPSGLLNIADERRDMYNHGLSTFMLGQAYGITGDRRLSNTLDRALKLIVQTQANDGGWRYKAERQSAGSDLSLAVMQALALRSAVDIGLEVPPESVLRAIQSVREHYVPKGCSRDAREEVQRRHPGQFHYNKHSEKGTTAMAAAGVVCLQEFAQYGDWRIEKNMDVLSQTIQKLANPRNARKTHQSPFDAYTLYYISQALYQVGGKPWEQNYPQLRDSLVASQIHNPDRPDQHGMWREQKYVNGQPGRLYMTAVACFVLAIPNRYLPILQEGKIDSLQNLFGVKQEQ